MISNPNKERINHPIISKSTSIEYMNDVTINKSFILGSGSYGRVYLGMLQNQQIAIKVFSNNVQFVSDASELSKEVLKEIKVPEKLTDFSYICKYHGLTSIEGELGLVMEYVDNCSLHTWLHRFPNDPDHPKSLTNSQKHQIQIGIASALQYIHSNKIAHNDLKPLNIMLDSQFNPKLIDFGMVKLLNSSLKSVGNSYRVPSGTINYRPPEYWSNNVTQSQQFPFAGDIYSFAIILGEMATNRIPWSNCNIIENQIKNELRPYSKDQINPQLFQIIEKSWQLHPKDRNDISTILKQLQHYNELNQVNKLHGIALYRAFKKSIVNTNSELFELILIKMIQFLVPDDIRRYNNTLSHLNSQIKQIISQITNPVTIFQEQLSIHEILS
eukprot:NODE_427_length_7663_cov_0.258461.p2 type:complete len:385 gc:universal NODE_427_length_7663_cov_0.258461:4627-5781(+)